MNPGLVAARGGGRHLPAARAVRAAPAAGELRRARADRCSASRFMAAEAFLPSFGALGIGGAGRVRDRLGDADRRRDVPPASACRYALIGGVAAASAAFLVAGARHARAQGAARAGGERARAMLGAVGRGAGGFRRRRLGARAAASAGACAPARRCAAASACASPACDGLVLTRLRKETTDEHRFPFGLSFAIGARRAGRCILLARRSRSCASTSAAWCSCSAASTAVKGPGLIIIIPVVQQMVRVDLRTVVLDVPPQDVISRDNVSVKVNAVVYFRVVDPQQGDHPGGELHRRHQPARADHAARGARQARARPDAGRAREAQHRHPGGARLADRRLGHQGVQRRDQARRPERDHGARHRAPGRGRARAARQGDPRRRRAAGLREAARRRRRCWRSAPRRCSCATCRP